MLMELSFLVYTFFEIPPRQQCTSMAEKGLVPASFQARVTNLAMAKRFEGEICQLRELYSHMEIKIETLRRQVSL